MNMAGFFRFFDQSKPGPGVEKEGPKKKRFVIFFEIFFRKFWSLVKANLLYVLVSIPIVTNGLATAGLTYITRNYAREKHAFIASDFFDTIKKNLKQGVIVSLINLVVSAILFFDLYILLFSRASENIGNSTFRMILSGLLLSVLIIFTFMKYYIYMLMITFDLSTKDLYKNSFIFSFAGFPRNLLILIITLLGYAAGYYLIKFLDVPGFIIAGVFALFIFPAFKSLLTQFTVFPIIKKHVIDPYYENNPDADRSALAELNIKDEFVEEDKIFTDALHKERDKIEDKDKEELPRQYSKEEISTIHRGHYDNFDDDDII